MSISPPPLLFQALAAFADIAKTLPRPFMIIGGIAVIARGVPRQTVDVDATIAADGLDVPDLLRQLEAAGFHARIPAALEFAAQNQMLLIRHAPTKTDVDLSLGWLAFELDAIDRATPVDVAGTVVPVAQPDDLVVLKAVAWRPRDQSDIERLVAIHGKSLDLDRLRHTVAQFYALLEEPERMADFDALIASALKLGSDLP